MTYLSEDFMLQSASAKKLYHDYAESMPILDYHCHLSPQLIAQDAPFDTITKLWLYGDHYKWRVMRTNGIDERYITGKASDEERFLKWAETVPSAVRNPMYDWVHLELKRYFGIEDMLLSKATGPAIYKRCNEKLRERALSTRGLLLMMNVKVVCTTDDPIDDLSSHAALKKEGFAIRVLPTFRPDKVMATGDPAAFNAYIDKLSAAADRSIATYDDLLKALDDRHAFFHENGCRSSDHGLETVPVEQAPESEVKALFADLREGKKVPDAQANKYRSAIVLEMARMNHRRGWIQQFHLGVIRNARSTLFANLGPDVGGDCIGDFSHGRQVCQFLDALDKTSQLAKTVLYSINPGDHELFASIAGVFQDGSTVGKIQYGPAWWFLDQKDGMIKQMNALSSLGLLSLFIGMTTDSRSLLSFPRHEYFRRLLCTMLGEEMDKGELPSDMDFIGGIVKDICFNNAKKYFGY